MMQLDLELKPILSSPKPKPPERVRKKFWLTYRNANLVYQISMVTGKRPSGIVNDAIAIFAILVKCSQSKGIRMDDAEEIAEALGRYLSERSYSDDDAEELGADGVFSDRGI